MNPSTRYPRLYLDEEPLVLDSRPGRGSISPGGLAMVGMAPSPNRPRERENEPFGASSFEMLRKITRLFEDPVYVTNVIKTPFPVGKKPPKRLLQPYQALLMDELKSIEPKRVLALGTVAARTLCPGFDSLREDHGTLFYNPELHCVVVPTYHFSAVGRNPTYRPILARDMQRFIELPDPKPPHYILNPSIIEVGETPYVVMDLETVDVSLNTKVLMIGLLCPGQDPIIFDKVDPELFHFVYRTLRESKATIVGHNLPFDLTRASLNSGDDWSAFPVEDTMMIAHVAGEEILALKHLTTFYTDRPGSRAFGGTEDYGYLAEDLLSTWEVRGVFEKKGTLIEYATNLSNTAVPIISQIERNGVYLDYDLLQTLEPQYQKAVDEQVAKLAESGQTINWNSSQQVAQFLIDHGVKLTETTDAGNYSVKETVLLALADKYPMVKEILTLREKQKELTFLKSYQEMTTRQSPFLNPKMKIAGTVTGRLSCEKPNVQQVKRTGPIKLLYRSRHGDDGLIGLIDLSQAELRVACLLSDDELFMEALLSEDVHRTIASWIYGLPRDQVSAIQRKRSKAITFGLLYGGSPKGLAKRANMEVKEVEQVVTKFFSRFQKLRKYIQDTTNEAIAHKEVWTLFGRRRDLTSLILLEGISSAERKAINAPIQSLASDIALSIMCYANPMFIRKGLKTRVIFGVHDSILIDIYKPELDMVVHIIQHGFLELKHTPLSKCNLWGLLPFVGEFVIGDTWAATESTNENYNPIAKYPCSSQPEAEAGGVISERDIEDVASEDEGEEETEDIEEGEVV